MRGVDKQAIVCRKADGTLETKVEPLNFIKDKYPILGVPFIRGVVTFIDSMVKGMNALTYSASLLPEDEQEEPTKFDLWLEKKLGSEKAEKAIISIAVVLGILLAVGLFVLLPAFLFELLPDSIGLVTRCILEGIIRIAIFLVYMWLCTRVKDVQRMFSYHGAEHKTIFCYEKRLPLTVENVRKQSRFHPRCGTSFLFVVVVVSILVSSLVFSFVNWRNMWVRVALHLLLLIPIVGVTYEFNRYVGGHDNKVTRFLARPGLWLQNFTTNEPDDSMLEVAIRALELVIPEEKGKDAW